MESYPRTPSPPPPPPPTPPEVQQPMDLSSERRPGDQGSPYPAGTDYETPKQNQVGSVLLRGISIVSLFIDEQERLCLAQISNTLLKNFSYNEIHNRRVALGITCVQCTPVQLEILRRAGAMPISSRRCGMITKREAERLIKSFLEEHMPPKLPDNFAFKVTHTCGWGCKGNFIPSRYNSSRAKCIKCTYCNLFFSPNKFIFHYHRAPDAKYRHPDAANFNSWRRHLDLDYDLLSEDLTHAWEDVKAMFNGGSRKRLLASGDLSPGDEVCEKRSRLSLDHHAAGRVPKLTHDTNCSVFPPMNSVPNLFSQQTPYNNFPLMHNNAAIEPVVPDRRMCMPDLWRPKNAMPYYNPLGLMWAKNFGFCPPAAAVKPDVMRETGLRMPNFFMDMNGNKTATVTMNKPTSNAISSETTDKKSCDAESAAQTGSRTSAFRPVGNFTYSPNSDDEYPTLSRPPRSDLSDRLSEDEFSDNLAEDEDVDVDGEEVQEKQGIEEPPLFINPSAEGSLAPQPTTTTSTALDPSQQLQRSPSSPRLNINQSVRKEATLSSFTIDSLFDTKVVYVKQTDPGCASGEHEALSTPDHQMSPCDGQQHASVGVESGNDVITTPNMATLPDKSNTSSTGVGEDPNPDLGFILQLSKEQLQSELLRMLGMKQRMSPNGESAKEQNVSVEADRLDTKMHLTS